MATRRILYGFDDDDDDDDNDDDDDDDEPDYIEMRQESPALYYDPDLSRYFPIKGPPIENLSLQSTQVRGSDKKNHRVSKLVYDRELYGNIINFSNKKCSFEGEYLKKLASHPKVWKYQGLDRDGDGPLTIVKLDIQTPVGQCGADGLLTGSMNGSLRLFDVGNVGQQFNHRRKTTSNCVWPESYEGECSETLKDIWKLNTLILPSGISCINMPRQENLPAGDDGPVPRRALVTTLGSEISGGGSLYILNLTDLVDLNSNIPSIGRLHELATLNCTIWGADYNYSARKAVVGTNLGGTLVDMETGAQSMLCSCKSDMLSVQLIQLGNAVLCGLRNGAVVTVDVRQRQRQVARHRIPYTSRDATETSNRNAHRTTKSWFSLKGNIQPDSTILLPSAVSCLVSLQMYDQYFLASSMDGSIKLFDHRLTKRGPVQFYEGHVNSDTRIQLAADTSEKFFMSGGEDSKVRIWSIKSGELLFQEKFSSNIPSSVCWQGNGGCSTMTNKTGRLGDLCGWDAWLKSADGLFRMQFP